MADKCRSYRCCLSSSFIALLFCALFLSKAFPCSLCVLPHCFPPQQCVALVITSCLKQTDGIRESDGQFSRCFPPCLCTQLLFCGCFFFAIASLPHAISHKTHPPPHQLSLDLCMTGVCVCVCVFIACEANVGNYLTRWVSPVGQSHVLLLCWPC